DNNVWRESQGVGHAGLSQVVSFFLPAIISWGQLITLFTSPLFNGRAGSDAFQAIAMIRTNTSKIITGQAMHHDMTAFRMAATTVKFAVRNIANTDTGTDSDVKNVLLANTGAFFILTISSHIHISRPNERNL